MSTETGDNHHRMSYEDVLHLFRTSDEAPLTAKEVADEFDITRQAANYRLEQLVERGKIKRKKVGSSAVIYWHPDRIDTQ